MRHRLRPHPDHLGRAVRSIDVEVQRLPASRLVLRYTLAGAIDALRIPPPATPRRRDELWRHSCFEAFVRDGAHAPHYVEFNFAPSGQWAAYAFRFYRDGMSAPDIPSPRIAVDRRADALDVEVSVEATGLLPAATPWRLGLAAVIEEKDGALSYWALAHPQGKPDFHHQDCFAVELPAPRQS